jgi:hypothetical protein
MSDTICLDKRGDYYCTLTRGHEGPHQAWREDPNDAFHARPEDFPGCVWEQEDEHV